MHVAELGTCRLESGQTIQGCRLGYRTFGTLDATRSNVIVFPTWFTGTTANLVDVVPDKLVDTKRFFLVLVDALGDGVSSSPSNSVTQARLAFPKFTIHDMVVAEERLVREVLHVDRLYAVMGISMGGMQALEWAVWRRDAPYGGSLAERPIVPERVVSIVGTPQLTAHDMLLWNTELHALEDDVAYAKGEYRGRPKIRVVQDIHWMMLGTPKLRAEETSRADFARWLADKEADTAFDWNDWHRQLEAMLAHDVARGHADLAAAAKTVTAKTLIVVAEHDHMVYPGPSKAFAKASGAKLVVLDGPCGHAAPACDGDVIGREVRAHLAP